MIIKITKIQQSEEHKLILLWQATLLTGAWSIKYICTYLHQSPKYLNEHQISGTLQCFISNRLGLHYFIKIINEEAHRINDRGIGILQSPFTPMVKQDSNRGLIKESLEDLGECNGKKLDQSCFNMFEASTWNILFKHGQA